MHGPSQAIQGFPQPMATVVSAGTVVMFAGATVPGGWLNCDGSAVRRGQYPDLFAAIGTAWGTGDGTSTFNLPDLRGRAPIGVGQGSGLTNRALAATGGAETHTLATSEIPSHTHTIYATFSPAGCGSCYPVPTGPTGYATDATGGGGSHNNMQPFAALNFIVKT